MSTEKIDVLSVMRCVTATVLQGEARSCMREDMDKARAAVAELIDDLKLYLKAHETDDCDPDYHWIRRERLRASLTRVQALGD